MQIKTVSFNIRYKDDPDGNSVRERAPRLYETVKDVSPDIIGFQEYTPLWEEPISAFFAEEYEIFNKYRSEKSPEAPPVLWKKDKFDLIESGHFWLSDTPEKESRGWDTIGCNRICLYCRLREKATGSELVFFNTHFGFSDACQIKSARLIKEKTEPFSALPVIITGDFNMKPDAPGYSEMTSFMRDANILTAKDMRATYHGYEPERFTDGHIDYCFINANVKAVSRKLLTRSFDGKYPSDHFGIETVVEV